MTPANAMLTTLLLVSTAGGAGATPAPRAAKGAGGAAANLACAGEPLRTGGPVYYYCDCQAGADGQCQAGNDASAGTSPSAPRRSFADALSRFNGMKSGSTVAFCRGGAWSIGTNYNTITNSRCSASSTCDWRDYTPPWATGGKVRPKLSFTSTSYGNGLAFVSSGAGFRVFNLWLHGPGTSEGLFFFNQVDDVDVCNVRLEHWAGGVNLASGNTLKHRITFRDSQLLDISDQGWLGACESLTISGNTFDNVGAAGTFNHSIYVSGADIDGTATPTDNIVVKNNTIINPGYGGTCAGTILVVHGRHTNVLVEGNTIDATGRNQQPTCYGLSFKSGYSCSFAGAEYLRNAVLRGNKVIATAQNGIVGNSCNGCTIENNVVVSTVNDPVGIRLERSDTGDCDDPNTNVVIRNNTLLVSGAGVQIQAAEGGGHVVASNAVLNTGSLRSWSCFDVKGVSAMDHNLCWYATGGWAPGHATLSAWQATGWDHGSWQAEPQFTASPGNLVPLATSPLLGRASATQHASTDFTGKPRDAAPDIGAYQR